MERPPSANGPLPPDRPQAKIPVSRRRDHLGDPLQIGLNIVGVTAAFGGIGWWIDHLLGIFPILMAVSSSVGLFSVLYWTYKRLQHINQDTLTLSDDKDRNPAEKL